MRRDAVGVELQVRPETVNDGPGMCIVDNLCDYAVGVKASGFVVNWQAANPRNCGAEKVIAGLDDFLSHPVEHFGGAHHFVGHDADMPGTAIGPEDALHHAHDERGKGGFRGQRCQIWLEGLNIRRPGHRLPDNLHVKARLIAEVVVDGGDIGPGLVTNITDCDGVEASLGEGGTCRFEEPGAGTFVFGLLH